MQCRRSQRVGWVVIFRGVKSELSLPKCEDFYVKQWLKPISWASKHFNWSEIASEWEWCHIIENCPGCVMVISQIDFRGIMASWMMHVFKFELKWFKFRYFATTLKKCQNHQLWMKNCYLFLPYVGSKKVLTWIKMSKHSSWVSFRWCSMVLRGQMGCWKKCCIAVPYSTVQNCNNSAPPPAGYWKSCRPTAKY